MAYQAPPRQGFQQQQQPGFGGHHQHHQHHHAQPQFGAPQFNAAAQPTIGFPGMGQVPPQPQGFPQQQSYPQFAQPHHHGHHHQHHHGHHQHHHAHHAPRHHHGHHHHHAHQAPHHHAPAPVVQVQPAAPAAPAGPNFQGFVGGNGFQQQSFGRGGFGGPQQQPPQQSYEPYTREDVSEDQLFKDHTPGINFDKYESIDVTVTPNEVPPCDVFQAMDFNSLLHDNIRRCNYTKPTPVQKHGIPIVLAGKDLMACAQTGSGKTAAYLLPALHHAMKYLTPHQGRSAHPSALILAPTRELALQIYDEGRKFTFRTGLRCVVVYGGADSRHQIYELQRGANLIVATPGRLLEMFQRGIVSFSQLKYLVLDEADRMLDMGFEPQIRQLVEGPDSDMPPAGVRQTLMYSATFPREIQQLARAFLANHVFLQVGRVGSTTDNITQDVRWVEESDKREMLLQILGANLESLVLVFVEKKREADYLERYLHHNRISATSIHGDRTQREREMALHYFKTGACRILVATDVAARGLDIPNVSLVVQYDLPTNIDDYVHRIGRTGRAGKTGTAIAFFNDKNVNIVDDLVVLLEESKQQVPDYLRPLMKRRPVIQARGRGGNRGGYFRGGRGFGRGRGAAPGAGGYGGFGNFNNHHHPHHVGQGSHGGNHFAAPARF